MPVSLGDFITINNPIKGKPLTECHKFLDKVHLEIVYMLIVLALVVSDLLCSLSMLPHGTAVSLV
jgi:hypothetical protein